MGQENQAFNALCEMTTQFFAQFGARPAAFKEACRQRPDLAADAIYPSGARVIPRAEGAPGGQQPQQPDEERLARTFEEEMAAAEDGPLAKAIQRSIDTMQR